ncbi:MAG: hypothetical protein LC777_09115, partial [Actinobacteria bacterium]|nr:hypothetical protein [Actinomycetota bacterium]
MTNAPEPLDVVRADVERKLRKRVENISWAAGKWLGPQLVGLLANGLVSVGLLLAFAPIVVAGGVAIAFALMAAYLVGQRRQYVHLETQTRWRLQIENKRLRQQVLKGELALRRATLLLAGDPRDREERFRIHAPGSSEFVTALRY